MKTFAFYASANADKPLVQGVVFDDGACATRASGDTRTFASFSDALASLGGERVVVVWDQIHAGEAPVRDVCLY